MGTNSSNEDNTMSFINLLANDIWSDADMLRRTESMIRSEFSQEAETILNRKAVGMALGTYTPSAEELAEMERYTEVVEAARVELRAAQADMALLLKVFELEKADRVVKQMPLSEALIVINSVKPEEIIDELGNVTNQEDIDTYNISINNAQVVISAYGSIQPVLDEEGNIVNQTEIDEYNASNVATNEAARAAAQLILDEAEQPVKDLFLLRNPQG